MCRFCPTPDIEPFKPRVREGIKFLDTYGPDDWRDSIAVKKLDMDSGLKCVLGQIYGDYTSGLRELEICPKHAIVLGFTEPDEDDGDDDEDTEANIRALSAAWRAVLAEPAGSTTS